MIQATSYQHKVFPIPVPQVWEPDLLLPKAFSCRITHIESNCIYFRVKAAVVYWQCCWLTGIHLLDRHTVVSSRRQCKKCTIFLLHCSEGLADSMQGLSSCILSCWIWLSGGLATSWPVGVTESNPIWGTPTLDACWNPGEKSCSTAVSVFPWIIWWAAWICFLWACFTVLRKRMKKEKERPTMGWESSVPLFSLPSPLKYTYEDNSLPKHRTVTKPISMWYGVLIVYKPNLLGCASHSPTTRDVT